MISAPKPDGAISVSEAIRAGSPGGDREGDGTAHGVADQVGPFGAEGVEHAGHGVGQDAEGAA